MTVAKITEFPDDHSPAPVVAAAIVLIVILSAEPIARARTSWFTRFTHTWVG
jgi:hypothetical protein